MRLNRSLFLFHMRCGNATCLWSFSIRWNWSDMVPPLRHSSLKFFSTSAGPCPNRAADSRALAWANLFQFSEREPSELVRR